MSDLRKVCLCIRSPTRRQGFNQADQGRACLVRVSCAGSMAFCVGIVAAAAASSLADFDGALSRNKLEARVSVGLWVAVVGAGRRPALAAMFFVGTSKALAAKAPPARSVITHKINDIRFF